MPAFLQNFPCHIAGKTAADTWLTKSRQRKVTGGLIPGSITPHQKDHLAVPSDICGPRTEKQGGWLNERVFSTVQDALQVLPEGERENSVGLGM